MPKLHIVNLANKKALYADHDYLKENKEDKYLNSLCLDELQRQNLESKTKQEIKLWKKERVKRM